MSVEDIMARYDANYPDAAPWRRARFERSLEPWHVNPNYPYARDFPLVEAVGEPHRFEIGDRLHAQSVRVDDDDRGMVILTRRVKYYRRDAFTDQVMLDRLPGEWFAAAHFQKVL